MAEVNRECPQIPLNEENIPGVIFALFGIDKPKHMPSQKWAYCKVAYRNPVGMQVNLTEASWAYPQNSPIPITFIEDEGKRLHHPYFDTLVVDLEIKKHKVIRNMINNESSTYILFA